MFNPDPSKKTNIILNPGPPKQLAKPNVGIQITLPQSVINRLQEGPSQPSFAPKKGLDLSQPGPPGFGIWPVDNKKSSGPLLDNIEGTKRVNSAQAQPKTQAQPPQPPVQSKQSQPKQQQIQPQTTAQFTMQQSFQNPQLQTTIPPNPYAFDQFITNTNPDTPRNPNPNPPKSTLHRASTLPAGKQSQIKHSSPQGLGGYDKNYHPKSRYDILNHYYQMKQCPDDVREDFLLTESKNMTTLFKLPQGKQQQAYSKDRISFIEYNQVKEPMLSTIKQFWANAITEFITRYHPYCSFEGIVTLAQFHIKQNHQTYYPHGNVNYEIYQQDGKYPGQTSPLTMSVINALSYMLSNYVNQFCTIVSTVPDQLKTKFLNNKQLIANIWSVFKLLFSKDYLTKNHNHIQVRDKIGLDLISVLSIIHGKLASAFSTDFVLGYLKFLDDHIQHISRNYDASQSLGGGRHRDAVMGRKCVRLANQLLLKFPYELQKWDEKVKKCIKDTKSICLAPFKWLLTYKKPALSRFDNYNEQAYKSEYFPILGSQWLIFLNNMIRKQDKLRSINEHYKQIIFYLMCSIIEQDLLGFWTNLSKFEHIYNYISSNLYESMKTEEEEWSPSFVGSLGKLARIMVCTCTRLGLGADGDAGVSRELLTKLNKDSIMLSATEKGDSSKDVSLSALVYNNFVGSVIQSPTLTIHKLFCQKFMRHLVHSQEDQPIYITDNRIILKYNYQYPSIAIHQLFLHLLIDNPALFPTILLYYKKQKSHEEHAEQPIKQTAIEYLKFVFNHAEKISAIYDGGDHELVHANLEDVQVLPLLFEFLSALVTNQDTKELGFALLDDQEILGSQKIMSLLENGMIYECNIRAITRHLQKLYQNGLQGLEWVKSICLPVIQKSITQPQHIGRHYANITRIALSKFHIRCTTDKTLQSLTQQNLLILDPSIDMTSSSNFNNNERDIQSYVKIPELNVYGDCVLEYIMWALRVEEDGLSQGDFYNVLQVNRRYESLKAALKLLQMFIVTYTKFHDRVYFPERLRRFLSICHTTTPLGMPSFSVPSKTSLSVVPQIPLSNKKLATLPACLAYLIAEPTLSQDMDVAGNQSLNGKEIRSIAINILNIIIVSGSKSKYYMLAADRQNEDAILDPIQSIDFNIYQQFFIGQCQKIYSNPKTLLTQHIHSQLCNKTNTLSLTPLSWFQSSYSYGQYLDLATQIGSLFNSDTLHEALEHRIRGELHHREVMLMKMRKIMDGFYVGSALHAGFSTKDAMEAYLADYMCDREVAAFSRFLLQYAILFRKSKQKFKTLMFKILQIILQKLLTMIIEQPDCGTKSSIVQSISTNLWKTVRVLQTKPNLYLYKQFLLAAMPFILNYYHIKITDPEYIREYLIAIRLVLGCHEYLPKELYDQVVGIDKLREMLVRLMRDLAAAPQFYTVLFYCLGFYQRIVQALKMNKQEYKQQLLSIYNSVNETINPLYYDYDNSSSQSRRIRRPELSSLCSDITIVSVIMFFQLNIPDLIDYNYTRSQSLFKLLLSAQPDSSSTDSPKPPLNYQSLLLNMPKNPSLLTLETALQIANNCNHYLEFVSACHHLYTGLSDDQLYEEGEQFIKVLDRVIIFVDRVLDLEIVGAAGDGNWRNIALMKGWVCNLLYIIMDKCSQSTLIRVSHLLLTKTSLLSLLGQLLTQYGQVPIKWPYPRTFRLPKLTLLDKELLLSILKAYTAVIAKNDEWIKKSVYGNAEKGKGSMYLNLCRCLVDASVVIGKGWNANGHEMQNPQLGSEARTEYEESLQKLSLKFLYKPYLTREQLRQTQSPTRMRSSEQILDLQPSKIQPLHPSCLNSLDICHSHLNLLITQQYLMILLGCYSNPDVIVQKYQFHPIIRVLECITARLASISPYRDRFQQVLTQIDSKLWRSYKMDTNLYYLNNLHESPKETIELLNTCAELTMSCLIVLKSVMEMHRDGTKFINETEKVFKEVSRNKKAFTGFDLEEYFIQGGFDRSQKGTSYMMSPSARILF